MVWRQLVYPLQMSENIKNTGYNPYGNRGYYLENNFWTRIQKIQFAIFLQFSIDTTLQFILWHHEFI